jgi:hypothetical protein
MDAAEDHDVLLQKTSASMLEELRASLPRFLYVKDGSHQTPCARHFVRYSTTVELIRLVGIAIISSKSVDY